jgi:hypothetical protein
MWIPVGIAMAVSGPVIALLCGAMAFSGAEDLNECESIHCGPEYRFDAPDVAWMLLALLAFVAGITGVVFFFVGLITSISRARRAARAVRP